MDTEAPDSAETGMSTKNIGNTIVATPEPQVLTVPTATLTEEEKPVLTAAPAEHAMPPQQLFVLPILTAVPVAILVLDSAAAEMSTSHI